MLQAMFVKTGKTVDFSNMIPDIAVKEIVTGEAVTLFLEDVVVTADIETGSIAALEACFGDISPKVAIKHNVEPGLIKNLLTLAIDDTASYDGVEEFFSDFPVRFVP